MVCGGRHRDADRACRKLGGARRRAEEQSRLGGTLHASGGVRTRRAERKVEPRQPDPRSLRRLHERHR